MPFKVAVVGRPRDPGISALITDYQTRASRYWPLSFQEVAAGGAGSAPAALVKKREAEKLLRSVPASAKLVACDQLGDEMSSEELAAWLVRERDSASSLAFVIGGAFGLHNDVRSRAGVLLSLSRLTLPHELARLVLTEQLYRAGTIARGEPYHK
jgi:23S rRNA (pseudouridine1915-N3)-methyltransferase